MSEWFCFKDKVKMEMKPVRLGYGPAEAEQEALVCPKCRTVYVTEEVTIEKLLPAEDLMEEK